MGCVSAKDGRPIPSVKPEDDKGAGTKEAVNAVQPNSKVEPRIID